MPMKEGIGEILQIARLIPMLPISQITHKNLGNMWVVKKTAASRMEQRGKTTDACSAHNSAWPQHAMGLTQTSSTIVAVSASDTADPTVGSARCCGHVASNAHPQRPLARRMPRLRCRSPECLIPMLRYRINPVDMVSESREPASINTGASTCVNNGSGRIWQVAQDQFLRARVLGLKTIRRAKATTHRAANRGEQFPQ